MRTIILASASPRRKELLQRLGLEFVVGLPLKQLATTLYNDFNITTKLI